MAESSASSGSQPKIIEQIVEAGKKAFNQAADTELREQGEVEYRELIARTETWVLLPALNALIKPNVLPPWLRQPLMQTLTTLPLRRDGVRATMEFVFSVHPSNTEGAPEPGSSQKQGASITHEAVAIATRLLSSVPAVMTPQEWFGGISGQLLRLMDGEAGPDLVKTAAQVVGFGILGKKQLGAPGAPGWNAFVQPLLEDVNPSLGTEKTQAEMADEDRVIDLTQGNVLVSASSLRVSLRRLEVLIVSNPSPGLCKRVVSPVLAQLWALASWKGLAPEADRNIRPPAQNLLHVFLRLFGNAETLLTLVHDLLSKGSGQSASAPWLYQVQPDNSVVIVPLLSQRSNLELDWSEIEEKSSTLVELISTTGSPEETSALFLRLLRNWIRAAEAQIDIKIATETSDHYSASPVDGLIELSVLQKLMEKTPEKLISHFSQLLELVCQVLQAHERSHLDDEILSVVLSLLNLVITAPTFRRSDIRKGDMQIIENSLEALSNAGSPQVAPTARNLSMLLKFKDEIDEAEGEVPSGANARQIEDRRTYNLAMSYITGKEDNPPPVVSEGLNLLSSLITSQSPALDVTAVTVLMSNLVMDNEDYVNLRVIKVFTQLAVKHPKTTIREILDHYLDARERSTTDVRLRFGEALLQVIERLGETFVGDVARQTCETLLSIAGRRGFRPKTMAKQAREERLKQLKHNKAEADEEDIMDDDEDISEAQKAQNDILAQILSGWESSRGSEDVRMRASSLSVFGTAIETNIEGVGSSLISTGIDLCLHILGLEPEPEKAILRRSAVLVVLSFVKALDKAKEIGRSLGFGLTNESRNDIMTSLRYLAGTDNDGLVKQHAEDVIESLESWQVASMLPPQSSAENSGLGRLAGLNVNPEVSLPGTSSTPRPRIEEIE